MLRIIRSQLSLFLALALASICIVGLFFLRKNRDQSIEATMHQGEGFEEFIANCTGCHGPEQVIAPERHFKNWNEAILWMQKMQGMGPMQASTRDRVLKYLSQNYPLDHRENEQ